MVGALILVTAKIGTMKNIYEELKNMENIEEAEMLTGPYDIMAIARGGKMTEVTQILIEKIRNIEGVEDTVTNVFIE